MMPSEPDKKIEELLRTYARKRREDAGEPIEMHPVTRRLLQAEAAKLRPREAKSKRTLWSWLLLRWPRVAFAFGLIVLAGVAIWNSIPGGGLSSSPTLLAKQDKPAKAAPDTAVVGRDEAVDSEAKLGARFEQDKDRSKQVRPEALAPSSRLLDEAQGGRPVRSADAPTAVQLKEELYAKGVNPPPAPRDDLKVGEAEIAGGRAENQVMLRKLQAGAAAPQGTAGGTLGRWEAPVTNALPSSLSLAQAPGADAKGKQLEFTYSAPGDAVNADPYNRLPLATRTGPATGAAPYFVVRGGPPPAADRQASASSGSVVPAAPSPKTAADLAFDSLNYNIKGGRADLNVEARNGATLQSLGDRTQSRARVTGADAGGVALAKVATQPTALPKQYLRFQRLAEPEKAIAAKPATKSAFAGVLTTFDVELDGDRVRVTDSDGSGYAGHFVTPAEIGQARFAEIAEGLSGPATLRSEPRRQSVTVDSARRAYSFGGTGPATTNRVFRANGTNRTYGQLVTIEALLDGGSEALANGNWRGLAPAPATPAPVIAPAAEPATRFSAPAPTGAAAPASEAKESMRLVGRVSIGGSNESKLIAVPVQASAK